MTWGWMPPHPSFFIKREHFKNYGLFNTNYRISADYDFMLRILKNSDLKIHYFPEVLVKMRTGGMSNNGLKAFIKKTKEDWDIIKSNQVGGLHTLFFKKFFKISQYF